jgi:hypothetical protein
MSPSCRVRERRTARSSECRPATRRCDAEIADDRGGRRPIGNGSASAADLERRLNTEGVPAARVRTLREFVAEAADGGLLEPARLGDGGEAAISPGLGWRCTD